MEKLKQLVDGIITPEEEEEEDEGGRRAGDESVEGTLESLEDETVASVLKYLHENKGICF